MHRFFIPNVRPNAQGDLDLTPIVHQLQRVLRLTPGAQLMVLDNHGLGYTVRLVQLDKHAAQGHVLSRYPVPEPALQLSLYQCALKADKFEWILQKGTELGVSRFVPVISARTIVRPLSVLEKKRERWEAILREAAEQCGRGRVPDLGHPLVWEAALQAPGGEAATPDPPLKLLPWEDALRGSPPTAPALAQAVETWQQSRPSPSHAAPHIACAIGPEGGLEAEEVAAAQAAGWQTVHLGPRILRAETAALAVVTLLMQFCGEFGS